MLTYPSLNFRLSNESLLCVVLMSLKLGQWFMAGREGYMGFLVSNLSVLWSTGGNRDLEHILKPLSVCLSSGMFVRPPSLLMGLVYCVYSIFPLMKIASLSSGLPLLSLWPML